MTKPRDPDIPFAPSPAKNECMYSGLALDGSDEHVLAHAMGSTLSSKELVCSRVNGASATILEPAMYEPFEVLCHQLGIPGKKGGRNIRLTMKDGRTVEIGPDQRPKIVEKPKPKITRTDERTTISIEASDYEQMRKVAASAAGKQKQNIREEIKSVREEELGWIPVDFSIGGALWTNALRKTLLSLLGYFDSALVRSHHLQEARFLVHAALTRDSDQLPSCLCQATFDGSDAAAELGSQAIGIADHLLVVSLDGRRQRVAGLLRLFDALDFGLVLSTSYQGPSKSFIYRRNPLGKETSDTKLNQTEWACEAMAQLTELNHDERLARLRAGMVQVLTTASSRVREQAVGALLQDALPKWHFQDGNPLSDQPRFNEAAGRFSRDFLRAAIGLRDLVSSNVGDKLAATLARRLEATWGRHTGTTINAELRSTVGHEWLEILGEEFGQELLNAVAADVENTHPNK